MDMEEIMADNTFLLDCFHEESLVKVNRFYRRRHPLYPGMEGGNVIDVAEVEYTLQTLFEELLNKFPSLQK